jgi:hypothetical protein
MFFCLRGDDLRQKSSALRVIRAHPQITLIPQMSALEHLKKDFTGTLGSRGRNLPREAASDFSMAVSPAIEKKNLSLRALRLCGENLFVLSPAQDQSQKRRNHRPLPPS